MRIKRSLAYIWAAPTSALGLMFVVLTLLSGGSAKVVDGVVEVCGGISDFYLSKVVGLVLHGGASAMTLGHVVLGRDRDLLDVTRAHERIHVAQCERWGPFFVPAYLLASLAAWIAGKRPYEDNFFERQVFRQAPSQA